MGRRITRRANVYRFRRPRRRWRPSGRRGVSPAFIVGPLAVFTAVFLWDGGPPGFARMLEFGAPATTTRDPESARFDRCAGSLRYNCVVDGDTFWYRGEKIRLAGINAPEVSSPGCAREAELGEKASQRLQALLNDGPFSLTRNPFDPDRDRYERLLRDVTREGASIGETPCAPKAWPNAGKAIGEIGARHEGQRGLMSR